MLGCLGGMGLGWDMWGERGGGFSAEWLLELRRAMALDARCWTIVWHRWVFHGSVLADVIMH